MPSAKRILVVIPALVCLAAGPAGAVDLDTNAIVGIVEGINITEDTALNFGDVALNDGTLTLATDGTTLDPAFILFDATNTTQGVFTVTAVAGGSYDIGLAENVPIVGLTLDNFHLNIDAGVDEAGADNFVGVTLANPTSTLNVGADLTVDSATALLGAGQTIGYRVSVIFN